jgi:hypothetical protein
VGVEDASRADEDDDLAPFQIRRRWELRCIKQEHLSQTYRKYGNSPYFFFICDKIRKICLFIFGFKNDQMFDAVNLKLYQKIE